MRGHNPDFKKQNKNQMLHVLCHMLILDLIFIDVCVKVMKLEQRA